MKTSGIRGFTLIEVMVALIISGLAGLLAHHLFAATLDGSRRLRDVRRELDRQGNADQFLRAAFLSLEVGIDSADSFLGYPERVRFSTWLPTSDGWLERRTLELGLDGERWLATATSDVEVELAREISGLRLDYMSVPGAESHWVTTWESDVSAPPAVRIRLQRGKRVDTTVYLIKARG